MLVVEFRTDSPILRDALAHAPETTASYEEMYRTDDGIVFLFWVAGDDLTAFEEGLAIDPTVTDSAELSESDTRRLYRVTLTERGESVATFPSWGALEISLLEARGTYDGWDFRSRMPNRDTLRRFRETCEEKNVRFRLSSVYEADRTATETEARVTSAQREALITARELGYYEIPRRSSLNDVADHLDVSSQAVSTRLRRGTSTLVDATLRTDST